VKKLYTIHQAKTNLSRLVREAVDGAEVVIARGDAPLVRLVRISPAPEARELGFARGMVRLAPDFDAALEDLAEYEVPSRRPR